MASNPKDSEWRSTPRAKRHRKGTQLTLAEETVKMLRRLAEADGASKSEVVDVLVKKEHKRRFGT